jgi:amino acid adenylation domain-containing protein
MNELFKEIAGLSEEKRELLRRMLEREGIDIRRSVIVPVPRTTNRFPLSFSQQRLWFLEQLEPGSPLYTIPVALRLTGELESELLHRALRALVARHEVLRTTFGEEGDQPVQIIHPGMEVPLETTDLRGLPRESRLPEAERQAAEFSLRPFDLAHGPLMRARLWRLGELEHYLLLALHHIVTDGWSTGVLLHEIKSSYASYLGGEEPELPRLPIQYADYAVWQRGFMAGSLLESELAYWKEQLAGCPGLLELVTDFPRPALQTYEGSLRTFEWPRELSEGIAAIARQENATVFMVLLALFDTLLYRLTGQSDIAVGTPIANRTRTETEALLGFFVNTLVLRADLSGNPTFRELLRRVREGTLGALAHQDLPFETLVEALKPERNLSVTPLFQVMFVLNNAPLESLELPGLVLAPVEMDTGTTKFDLILSMIERKEGIRGKLEFNTDLFRPSTVDRIVQLLRDCAESMVRDPDERVSNLPFLSEEGKALLSAYAGRDDGVRDEKTPVHLVIEQHAVRSPDAVAVIVDGTRLTYAELQARADMLAGALLSLGIGPEASVGMLLERSPGMIVTLLAILRSGGVYVPLDPAYPPERLAFIMEDARIRAVVTRGALKERVGGFQGPIVDLDEMAWSGDSGSVPYPAVAPENLAYVIYTSGSTGQPKGVLVPHGELAGHCRDAVAQYALTPSDRMLVFASTNFDASLEQILGPLVAGGSIVLRGDDIWGTTEFFRRVRDLDLTIINPPTAYWHQLMREPSVGNDGSSLPRLRLCIAGGDQMIPEAVRQWYGSPLAGKRLLNAYGPTETVITAAIHEVPPPDTREGRLGRIPIGRPFPHRTAYVLDERGNPVPPGIPGELYLGGSRLARGYLNRPDLTAERFVPDHLGTDAGARLYRTGDRVRHLPNGTIEFLGRVDAQVKIRGFRVEPGEVESVLLEHPDVREAVVLPREEGGERRLVAYVVLREGAGIPLRELREFLQARIPEFMVPFAFVGLPAMPVNAVGKVDRHALPAPDRSRPEMKQPYLAPRSPVEEELADIVAKVLGLKRVGVLDNFFELGGHSMLATQVVSRVRQLYNLDLPLRSLFERPTVEGLSIALAKAYAEQTEGSELKEILSEIEQLPESEAAHALRGNGQHTSGAGPS